MKKKLLKDVKWYMWDEPFLFKKGADQVMITPKRVENKAVAVAQLGRSYPQGGDKLNKK